MIGWIVRRYAERYGYRSVPRRDVWAVLCDCDPADLTATGHANRSRAFIARKLANEAHDILDRFDSFEVLK